MNPFAAALAREGTTECCHLRSRFGFLAFHGGALERATDVIAAGAAELAGASYYGVSHAPGVVHFPSTSVDPRSSPALARFLAHVEVAVAVHGFGRQGYFSAMLFGGRNRVLAEHLAAAADSALPDYEAITDLTRIPRELRGQDPRNPVNLPRGGGVQIELPPRVRGTSPLWAHWRGPGPVPPAQRLIEALAAAALRWAG